MSEEELLELWESMFGDNAHATAGFYTTHYSHFMGLINQYTLTKQLEARIDEHHELDKAADLNLNIFEWSLYRENELQSQLTSNKSKD